MDFEEPGMDSWGRLAQRENKARKHEEFELVW